MFAQPEETLLSIGQGLLPRFRDRCLSGALRHPWLRALIVATARSPAIQPAGVTPRAAHPRPATNLVFASGGRAARPPPCHPGHGPTTAGAGPNPSLSARPAWRATPPLRSLRGAPYATATGEGRRMSCFAAALRLSGRRTRSAPAQSRLDRPRKPHKTHILRLRLRKKENGMGGTAAPTVRAATAL